MADGTKIEWTDATWNPITGCAVVSPGCTNCYAMKLAGTRLKNHPSRKGLTKDTKAGPVWTSEMRLNRQWLDQPLRWTTPRMIFVCAHGDLFAEGVDQVWIDYVFAVMALAPQHTFQVLTKRPERMREYMLGMPSRRSFIAGYGALVRGGNLPDHYENAYEAVAKPLPNVWLGVSVEDQKRAEERIPTLLDTPAAIRWISAEPLLGPVHLKGWCTAAWDGDIRNRKPAPRLNWVVAGGESGPGARPMHPDWARSLRDQCAAAGVPFLFKQWGEWVPQVGAVDGWSIPDDPEVSRIDHRDWEGDHWGEPYRPMWCDDRDNDTVSRVGKRYAGRLLDGIEHNGFPGVRQ
ncbi:phage Gp37/Gp68 family protein [Sinorhizobium meliloti]|uniref:phage Gp37/Gp68 family protein n=1 Tax=Rhizobium meliloti TaxID=382 RepID=UPI0020732915|nr:phage Gp37/Gp68 family protein [Sinorhizobium meliloti]MCM5689204.1 phage Gp37/Gp68 family protein [Sinorhizobium meliloti]